MVRTQSTMLPLGTQAPGFELTSVDGSTVSLTQLDQPVLLMMFLCNHCPYVIHVAPEIARLAQEYQHRGVDIVGVSSSDVSKYPMDSPEQMVHEAENRGYVFPYLYDEDQSVAKAYHAACTPDFYVFDRDRKLVYRGQLDASRPDSGIPLTGTDLRNALDATLAGRPVNPEQKPSLGCNIKWIEGEEPTYFDPVGIAKNMG